MKIKNLLAILAALVFSASVSAKQHTGLEIKVNPVKSSIGNDEDVTVKVSIKNRTGEKIDILRWFLPDSDGILEEGIFKVTRDGEAARYFTDNIQVGMVGVNIPLPVPVSYHSFGGWKRSLFGDLSAYGPDAIKFYTRRKTVTQRWPSAGVREGVSFAFPS